jgi:hypothetical protein
MNGIGATPTVSSYAAPKLVEEINAGFVALAPILSTATTITITSHTPRMRGDFLVGTEGAGTNVLYVAVGTTTNDWKKVTITN